MTAGFQRFALIAYVGLCVYLLAQPAPSKVAERAATLDKQLAAQTPDRVAPALAAALDMPLAKVDTYLSFPNTKPSDLVFAKLLDQAGVQADKERPLDTLLHAGVPAAKAINYFDTVEKSVEENLAKAPAPSVTAAKRSTRTFAQSATSAVIGSQPD